MSATHEHDWACRGCTLHVVCELDSWQGLADAIIECRCGAHALLLLVDWSQPGLGRRLYSVSALEPVVVATFLKNIDGSFCDLTRRAAEIAALVLTAAPVSAGLALDAATRSVIDTVDSPLFGVHHHHSFRDGLPPAEDSRLFEPFALDKVDSPS